jgi:hypothetical protein
MMSNKKPKKGTKSSACPKSGGQRFPKLAPLTPKSWAAVFHPYLARQSSFRRRPLPGIQLILNLHVILTNPIRQRGVWEYQDFRGRSQQFRRLL